MSFTPPTKPANPTPATFSAATLAMALEDIKATADENRRLVNLCIDYNHQLSRLADHNLSLKAELHAIRGILQTVPICINANRDSTETIARHVVSKLEDLEKELKTFKVKPPTERIETQEEIKARRERLLEAQAQLEAHFQIMKRYEPY